MDLTLPFCTYISLHLSTGCAYIGKGRTKLILEGKYKGSGTRFKAALQHPAFGWDTWSTNPIETFETEAEAYAAEACLVPLESLRNPLLLNEMVGGKAGRNQNRATLVRQEKAANKKAHRQEVATRRKQREAASRQKLADLRLTLRKSK
jgi:hypothetical protein